MIPQTKGGLVPAKITNLQNKKEVRCMFNPFEYTITKRNTWKNAENSGADLPYVTFSQGAPATLQLSLYFDTSAERVDVRTYTNPLLEMTLVDKARINPDTQKGEPPPVAFEWGRLYFQAVITNLQQKFLLFDEKGTPLRCQVNITLQQYQPKEDTETMVAGMRAGDKLAESVPYIAGQRLDNLISSKSTPRQIAEMNNIDNPLKVLVGTILKMTK